MTPRARALLVRLVAGIAAIAVLLWAAYKLFEDPANQVFGPTVVSGPADERVVALTYDDGPNPPYTERILDVLRAEHVHATFFVVGRAVAAYPGVVRRMVKEGNAVGNHTWDHVHLVLLRRSSMRSEMNRTEDAIGAASGVRPSIMRPPFGARDWRVLGEMKKLGYTVVMWSVPLPKDWEYPSAQTIAKRIVPNVKDGSIIVLHDGNRGQLCAARKLAPHVCDRSQDILATRLVIDELRRRGFTFVTIPELMARHKDTKHKPAHGIE